MTTQASIQLEKHLVDVEVIGDEKKGNGRWLSLHEVKFLDPSGIERSWEVCRRISAGTSNKSNKVPGTPSVDAVDVIPIIKTRCSQDKNKGHDQDQNQDQEQSEATHVALVIQYRPAMGAYTIEFPSGLIDANESSTEAALRELAEEVGYSEHLGHSVKVIKTLDPIAVAYEPGMTNSCSHVVIVEITMNHHQIFGSGSIRRPTPEDDEWSLQVVILPLKGLMNSLIELQSTAGESSKLVLDSRLYAWALGRELAY